MVICFSIQKSELQHYAVLWLQQQYNIHQNFCSCPKSNHAVFLTSCAVLGQGAPPGVSWLNGSNVTVLSLGVKEALKAQSVRGNMGHGS